MSPQVWNPELLEVGPANVYVQEGEVNIGLGFMGDTLAVNMGTTASDLTGAQTGDVPQDSVVSGGHFRIVVPFKEISMENMNRAFANCVLNASKQRVDFMPRLGLSLRSIAKRMTIKKLVGGVESLLPKDWFIIYLAAPATGDVNFPFHPTQQREILANFIAFPDRVTGRWSFMGDELSS